MGGISLAIKAIQFAWDKLNVTVEETQQKVDETSSRLKELQDLQAELSARDPESLSNTERERLAYLDDRIAKEKELLELQKARVAEEEIGGKFTDYFDDDSYSKKLADEYTGGWKNFLFNSAQFLSGSPSQAIMKDQDDSTVTNLNAKTENVLKAYNKYQEKYSKTLSDIADLKAKISNLDKDSYEYQIESTNLSAKQKALKDFDYSSANDLLTQQKEKVNEYSDAIDKLKKDSESPYLSSKSREYAKKEIEQYTKLKEAAEGYVKSLEKITLTPQSVEDNLNERLNKLTVNDLKENGFTDSELEILATASFDSDATIEDLRRVLQQAQAEANKNPIQAGVTVSSISDAMNIGTGNYDEENQAFSSTLGQDLENYQNEIQAIQQAIKGLGNGSTSVIDLATDFGIAGDSISDCKEQLDELAKTKMEEMRNHIDSIINNNNINSDTVDALENIKDSLDDVYNAASSFAGISLTGDALSDIEQLSKGLDQLDSIYADVLDGEDFDWGSILNNRDFQDTFGSMGEAYENFINTVTNNPADISACQAAFDDLTNAYIYQSGVLDELNESNAQAAINMLDSMGVANAEAVVMNYLAAQTEYAAIAKDNAAYSSAVLAEATLQDINNILMEGSVTEDTKNQIVAYYLEKLTASGISLDTAEDCNQLINLIDYLGGATDALRMYYSALQGSMNVTAVNGDNSHGGLSGKDTPYLEQMAKVQAQKEAEKKLNEMLEKTKNSMSKVSFKGGTKSNGVRKSQAKSSGSGKSKKDDAQKEAEEAAKKAEEERKKAIEEEEKRLEDALSRIQNAIDELDKEASNKFHNWDERNSALQAEMDTIPQAIAAQQQLVDFYNTTGNDPTKAQEAANAIKDLRRQLEELANQKLENIKQFNEDIISLIDSLKELSQSLIDIKEARGFAYNAGDYQELISKSEEERRQYEKELSELQAQLQYNIDRGYLQEGSETWYEWQKELNGIKKSMNECIKAQVEWNKEIQKIPFTALENFGKLIDKATTRLDNFASQLEERGLALSVADINEQLMAANEKLLIAQGNANEYYNVIRRNFSDEVNGWGKLTEEQLKQIFHYIDTDDSLRLHNYLADLGFDNYTLQEFYEYVEKLGEANNEIIELKTNIIKLNNAVGELNISGAEKYGILIEKLNNEISSYNNMLDARGLTASIEEIKNEMHGLASTAMIEQNKINNYYYAIRQGLSDSVNGWASLTKEEIDQVIKFIEMNDHQGIFDFFNGKGINPATLDRFWEYVQEIMTANSNIAEATANQIQLNKAIKQMDIKTYEKLNSILDKATTQIEGLRSLIESHNKPAPDFLLTEQIDNGMKKIDLYKRQIQAYYDYIEDNFSNGTTGWYKFNQDQINNIIGYIKSNDMATLSYYLDSFGLSVGTLEEFWEIVQNIQSAESNMWSEMVSQEGVLDDIMDNRISELEKIRDKLQEVNEEKNKALELEKARWELVKAMNNRNVMTYDSTNKQMIWISNPDEVSSAKDKLDDLELDALMDSIDDAIDAINDLKDEFNVYNDNGTTLSWREIIRTAQSQVNEIFGKVAHDVFAQHYDIDIPQFATGGVVGGNDKKDNTWIRVSSKERVLTERQNDLFENMVGLSNDFVRYMPDMVNYYRNTLPKAIPVNKTTNNVPVYQFTGDIVVPNVKDNDGLNVLIKDLQSARQKAEQMFSNINNR